MPKVSNSTFSNLPRSSRREILALSAGAAACSFTGSLSAFAQSELTGTLTLGIVSTQEPPMREVVKAYGQLRPKVTVQFNSFAGGSEQLRQNLITRQMANRIPDIVQTYDRFPRQFADANLTADMRKYLTSGGPVTELFFAEPFLAQYRVQGGNHDKEIHGLPVGADPVVLYYNKGHFDEAGLPYPDKNWTWADLVAAARKLTKVEGGKIQRFGFGCRYHWHATYVPRIAAYGGQFLGDDGYVHLTTPPAGKAFHDYLDFVQEGIFSTPAAIKAAGDEAVAFGSGVYSMMTLSRAGCARIRTTMKPGTDFDVEQQPTVNGVRKTGMGSVGLALTDAGMKNSKVAFDFLNFFFAEDGGMKTMAATYSVMPPVVRLYDSPIWRALPPPPANNQAYVDAIPNGVPNPAGIPADAQGTIDTAMQQVVDGVLIGGLKIEEALAKAENTINTELRRIRGT